MPVTDGFGALKDILALYKDTNFIMDGDYKRTSSKSIDELLKENFF
jgi:hypothetical protein